MTLILCLDFSKEERICVSRKIFELSMMIKGYVDTNSLFPVKISIKISFESMLAWQKETSRQ